MRCFLCLLGKRVIGIVTAIDGDAAWLLVKLMHPETERLVETLLPEPARIRLA